MITRLLNTWCWLSAGLLGFGILSNAHAATHEIDWTVSYQTVNFTGNPAQAITVNGQLPAPLLRAKEGDHLIINVRNQLDTGTAIHWHGLLVPWQMDGVEGVSQAPIMPGEVFRYEFTLKQSGTYWYHAHADLQEQQGLYGAIIIDPIEPPTYHYNKEQVIVLSDWNDAHPEQVYANLKKQGGYYATEFPIQPSLLKFLNDYKHGNAAQRDTLKSDYAMMQQMRMSIYDISDVAYDALLLNGQPRSRPWTSPVKKGDIVRLRFINASASTLFNVKIPDTSLTVVHVQGNDVKPYSIDEINFAPAETYDVLVKITEDKPYIIYAESSDTRSTIYGALVTDTNQAIDYQSVKPFPEPSPATMGHNMMGHGMSMDMSGHDMASMPASHNMAGHEMANMSHDMSSTPNSSDTRYKMLISPTKTNDPNKPVEIINMELSGYMERYIWFINGKTETEAQPILIEPGKRYRFIFTNNSMMYHPMHIHGHWLILRNGFGEYDPLVHTINVPPGATIIADFDADTDGQWFFHCHNLYHMMAGMARLFRYTNFDPHTLNDIHTHPQKTDTASLTPAEQLITKAQPHHQGIYSSVALDIGIDPFNNAQQGSLEWLIGTSVHRLQIATDEAELSKGTVEQADVDIFYWQLLNEFWAIKGGMNYTYQPAETPYWQPGAGIEGMLPFFIETNFTTYYHSGSVKFNIGLERDTQITNKFFINTGIETLIATKTVTEDEVGSGLNQMSYVLRPFYQLTPYLALFSQYEIQQDYGAMQSARKEEGEDTSEHTLTFGFSLLF